MIYKCNYINLNINIHTHIHIHIQVLYKNPTCVNGTIGSDVCSIDLAYNQNTKVCIHIYFYKCVNKYIQVYKYMYIHAYMYICTYG
jgi:Ser-tRNA(Ala) deacylase AlaX